MLGGVLVGDELDHVRPYAAEVEQRIALGGSAIGCDRLSLVARVNQETEQVAFQACGTLGKRIVARPAV
ncbi:hypothetical protein D3C83_241660 [compost metagenome]